MIPIEQFGEPLHRKQNSSGEVQFCCPQCHIRYPDKHPDISYHLYYNVYKQKFFCHRCGFRGRLDDLSPDISVIPSWEELTESLNKLLKGFYKIFV